MTVDNYFTRETDGFVHKTAKYYPEKIPIHHWQLRHYISNPEPDVLYYASSRDIFSLNTLTGVRTHITSLPFWARCTASGYGYVCAGGGEGGHFAIVNVHGTDLSEASAMLDASTWQEIRGAPSVQVEQAGTEIVNSISIHKLEGDEELGTLSDIVAVLTNNDKSIRIFSLTQYAQNTVLELPFPVNHATISPDGRTLVAVGDYQQAYFYDRVDLAPSPDSKSRKYASAHCMWELLNIVALHVPRTINNTGYFTTAWSPSGNLCAVASECGYVSVIDIEAMQKLEEAEDAIVVIMPSTRPENVHPSGAIPGAIRGMLFSPHPWDLLIWAEDQGRVCVADLRSGLRIKQVLQLDPDTEGYHHTELKNNVPTPIERQYDGDPEQEIWQQQLRSRLDETSEFLGVTLAEARRIYERPVPQGTFRTRADQLPESLTAQEREVLSAVGTSRHGGDGSSRSPLVRSINYSDILSDPSRLLAQQQSSIFAQDFPALARQNAEESSASTTTLPTTFRIMGEFMRDRANESNSQSPEPRTFGSRGTLRTGTHSSIRTSPPNDDVYPERQRVDRQAPTMSERTTLRSLSQTEGTRLLNILNQAPGYEALDSANASSSNGAPAAATTTAATAPNSASTPAPTVDPAEVRRRRAAIRTRERALANSAATTDPARYHRISILSARGDYYDPAMGLRTAGLAMSNDGRTLWCACDKGIFEFQVNVKERMGLKAIDLK